MVMMMAIIIRILGSRIGLAGLALMAALSWHFIDRTRAVRLCGERMATMIEREAVTAEIQALRARAATAERALRKLSQEALRAGQDARRAREELDAYETSSTVNPDCAVDGSVIRLLRNR